MSVAAVDIGTNSMRLLILDDDGHTLDRRVEVTGLGSGLDASGRLDDSAVTRTLEVLSSYRDALRQQSCRSVRVVATAATREAENGREFSDRAAVVLGHPLEVIDGDTEARLAYAGAMASLTAPVGLVPLVVDIGGGSTEFVSPTEAVSTKIGSVRLTDRALASRPASFEDLEAGIQLVSGALDGVDIPVKMPWMVGVAGTWTSLVGLLLGEYVVGEVHGAVVERLELDRLIGRLAQLTLEQTAELPGLVPKRAPVILAGAVIAREAMRHFGVSEATVSESDLLDALAASQL